MKKFVINVPIEVTQQDVDDIMVTALEGGINYWCEGIEVVNNDYKGGEYGSDVISRGGTLILSVEDDEPVELTLEKFQNGLQKFISSGSAEYGVINNDELDCGMIDAPASDLIIQYAVFGEIVFG